MRNDIRINSSIVVMMKHDAHHLRVSLVADPVEVRAKIAWDVVLVESTAYREFDHIDVSKTRTTPPAHHTIVLISIEASPGNCRVADVRVELRFHFKGNDHKGRHQQCSGEQRFHHVFLRRLIEHPFKQVGGRARWPSVSGPAKWTVMRTNQLLQRQPHERKGGSVDPIC